MMYEIIRNSLWAKPFPTLLIHLSERYMIQSSTDSEFWVFIIETGFLNFLKFAVSSSPLDYPFFPSEITS